jgi:DNA-binding LytR/AlgR family response regulator
MNRKLKCVLVDDSPYIIDAMKVLCRNFTTFELTETFTSPKEFLEAELKLDYDLCMLDICMPGIDGFAVAKRIYKPVIFITVAEEKLKEALALSPIDILTKPFTAERLNSAIEKAHKIIKNNGAANSCTLFNIAESSDKMKIFLADILFVKTDDIAPRNKVIYMKHGEKYTIMDCKFETLLEMAPTLIQVNRKSLVSIDAVMHVRHDLIILKNVTDNKGAVQVILSDTCRKKFMERMPPA